MKDKMKVSYKKELVKNRHRGLCIEVTYFVKDDMVHQDHYSLSSDPEWINELVEKNRLNMESNLNLD